MEIHSFYDLYANTYITNLILVIAITGLSVVMAIVLPLLDGALCQKAGVSLRGGIHESEHALRFLRIRKAVLLTLFGIYLLLLCYVVFFSRGVQADYHITNSIESFADLALIDLIFPRTELIEFYLNVMLFIPMGYMLPYLFRWFRVRAARRSVLICFLISIGIENIQLMTRRGSYDTGDILSNTIGGLLGAALFLWKAYTLTNPDWKKLMKNRRRYRHRAKEGALFPYSSRLNVIRTTLHATKEETIWEFYVSKLGLQLHRQLVPENSGETAFLFAVGRSQIEILCSNREEELPEQTLILSFTNLDKVKEHLENKGIQTSDYQIDPYSKHRRFSFDAPDHVKVTLIES